MSPETETATLAIGPHTAGVAISATEFDSTEGEPGWRYELIRGVVVSPAPSPMERGPNEFLERMLLNYQDGHPNGSQLDDTLPEHEIHVGEDRRRADRVIWAGLGRQPSVADTPAIAIEFVSAGKQNFSRNYDLKRHEYESIGIQEYWVFSRFDRTLTVFRPNIEPTVLDETQTLQTSFLPGFELDVAKLFAVADRWA